MAEREPRGAGPSPESRELLTWLERMGEATRRRERRPVAPDAGLSGRLEELVRDRPQVDRDHAQMHVDPASCLRRATAVMERVGEGTLLAVGDDDGVCLALGLLGAREVAVVDVDRRLLDWLGRAAGRIGLPLGLHEADVFEDAPPPALAGRCAAVVTDPARCFDDAMAFLGFGARCLRHDPAARLFWADHPDWNLEHGHVMAALPELSLALVETLEELHRYPLDPAWMPDPEEKARELGVDAAWLRALMGSTDAWSHLHVLRRTSAARRA